MDVKANNVSFEFSRVPLQDSVGSVRIQRNYMICYGGASSVSKMLCSTSLKHLKSTAESAVCPCFLLDKTQHPSLHSFMFIHALRLVPYETLELIEVDLMFFLFLLKHI